MKPIHILLVEDNQGDIFLTTEALDESRIDYKLSIAYDGVEALDFLNRGLSVEGSGLPDLILLDINLPKKSGHEVLQFIKSNDLFKHIPVIMLSTSSNEGDISRAYQNNASYFITKPLEINDFFKFINIIESYCFDEVTL